MSKDLEPAKAILRAFLADIEEVKKIRQCVSEPRMSIATRVADRMPIFDSSQFDPAPDSYWEKEDAYIWIHADAWNFRAYMHKPKPNVVPDYYKQPALPVYLQWRQEKKEVFHRKCEKIPAPASELTLADFLERLAFSISEENEHREVWLESLRSFLQFLRDDSELDQRGPLEMLFPSKDSCKGMEIRKGYSYQLKDKKIEEVERRSILRRIEDTVYPIDILATSEILRNLAKTVLEGRSNSQRSAAEALGFAWLCLAVAGYRLTTREGIVFSTETVALRDLSSNQPKERLTPIYFVGINSLFGVIDVPISKILHTYLLSLPRKSGENSLFTLPWKSLLHTFQMKGVRQSERCRSLGQITFLTFMSQPHEAIGHRPYLIHKK